MGTLVIKLQGMHQSWGTNSRFRDRRTDPYPSNSGITGLLAAAIGMERSDSMAYLANLRKFVRVDCPGKVVCDYQTAITRRYDVFTGRHVHPGNNATNEERLPTSNRYYLTDATFVVAVEMPDVLLPEVADALMHPAFNLYLGRKCCPPACKVLIGVREGVGAMEALKDVPWQVSEYKARQIAQSIDDETVSLKVVRDARPDDPPTAMRRTMRDMPLSFSMEQRRYASRTIVIDSIDVENPYATKKPRPPEHDPFAAVEAFEETDIQRKED